MIPAIVFGAAALALGLASVFSRRLSVRAWTYAVLVVSLFGLWWFSSGQSRPIVGCVRGPLVGYNLADPKIYLWIGNEMPITYDMPFSMEFAGQLQAAWKQATAQHLVLDFNSCGDSHKSTGQGDGQAQVGKDDGKSLATEAWGSGAISESGGMLMMHMPPPLPPKSLIQGTSP